MRKMRRTEIAFELKADGESGRVEGYGAVYEIADHGGDVIAAGAFSDSLAELETKDRPLPMLWQHDPGRPVGVWDEVREDDRGLRVAGQLLTDTEAGRDALAFLKARAISGLSIGYRTKSHRLDREKDLRVIEKAELFEVSLVTFPMNDEARVIAVKELPAMTERDIERALRDAGLSAREAKSLVSRCMELGAQRDAARIREAALAEAGLRRLLTTLTQ